MCKWALVALILSFVFQGMPAFADDTQEVFVCSTEDNAAFAASASRSMFLLDGGIAVIEALKKQKRCWFEPIKIPKKYTPLSKVYIQEGNGDAYVVVSLKIRGILRYVVFFNQVGPVVDV